MKTVLMMTRKHINIEKWIILSYIKNNMRHISNIFRWLFQDYVFKNITYFIQLNIKLYEKYLTKEFEWKIYSGILIFISTYKLLFENENIYTFIFLPRMNHSFFRFHVDIQTEQFNIEKNIFRSFNLHWLTIQQDKTL